MSPTPAARCCQAATVTLENVGTRDLRTTVTSDTGDYVFTLLPIGTYTVKIEMQGFQTQTARVVLTSGDRTRIDGRLSVGSVSESVMVTGESPLLQTDTSTLSSLVSEQAVQDLPVNGRNFMRLVQLVPGATEGAANAINSGSRPDDRRQTSSVSINGESENRNNQMIDGMDNNERSIGTVGVKPSMDAIAEVRVQTNLYSAEAGRASGGIINILTKSGSNQFHGTAYEFVRNDRFDSRDFFARVDPILKQHQFGGSLGGPLVSNRTFFFADYEGLRNTKGQVNNLTIPTLKMRQGDFSELLPTQIFDPTTAGRVAFPGNIIPPERLNPVALQYMALLPTPTTGGLANNAQTTTIGWQRSHTADGRVDHRFNGDNSMFVRYSYNRLNMLAPAGCDAAANGLTAVCRGPETGGFPGPNTTTASAIQTNYVRVFSPTLIGEFKGGYVKLDLASLPNNHGTNASESFGLKNTNVDEYRVGPGDPHHQRVYAARRLERRSADHSQPHAAIPRVGDQNGGRPQRQDRRRRHLATIRRDSEYRPPRDLDIRYHPHTQLRECGRQFRRVVHAGLSHHCGAHTNAIQAADAHERAECVRAGRLASHLMAHGEPRRPLRCLHAIQRGGK